MARKSSHVVVGVFVVVGTLLAAALIIWVGASRYFEKGARYVTFFDESVQGLQKDSPVKYRGVEVGRVEDILVAPDNRLIEVVMNIDLAEGVRKNLVAELKSVGITGIVFVELARLEPGEAPVVSKTGFETNYPVVPSRSSAIREAVTKVEEVLEKVNRIDFESITEQFRATGESAERFFEGPATRRLVETIDRLASRLDRVVARVDNVYSNERLSRISDAVMADAEALGRLIARVDEEISKAKIGDRSAEAKALIAESTALVAESKSLIADARKVVAGAGTVVSDAGSVVTDARKELQEMNLSETGQAAARISESFEEQQRSLVPAARESVDELRRASSELRELVKQLKDSPSELLFSNPPPHRK